MSAIQTQGLTKRFDGVVAVDDLDLVVEEGEIFGFLGPNGAGKSTTINLLLDFIRPTAGSATVLGLDAQTAAPAIRDRIGVLPEGYGFDEYLTGREYVEWTIETKDASVHPDTILRTVGLRDDADRVASGYSQGMQQRLAFGMALVGDPDLLILDEPSTGLDPNGMQEMRSVIRDRAARGTTVFFSSHILPEVEAVCDRVGVMSDGELVAVDSIEALRRRAGGTATVVLECTSPPAETDIDDLEGVVDVTVDGTTLTVACSDPAAKADVIASVAAETDILDVHVDETSLEELFTQFTGGGRDGDRRDEQATTSMPWDDTEVGRSR